MVFFRGRQKIAVVELFGTIGVSIKSSVYEQVLQKIQRDRRIRALVLDIDSPGGSVPASDYLYRRVARIAEEKPVVASIRGVGASGAYLLGCAAHKIVAVRGSLIGSIGVISVRPVMEELLGRLGVKVTVNKSGEFKDMGAFWRSATEGERQKMQSLIDESYEEFVSIVARSRNMDVEQVRGLATGEVFWAPRALELGLVDALGELDTAIDLAAELSGAPRRPVFIGPHRGFRARLIGPFAESLVETAATELERRFWAGYLRY